MIEIKPILLLLNEDGSKTKHALWKSSTGAPIIPTKGEGIIRDGKIYEVIAVTWYLERHWVIVTAEYISVVPLSQELQGL